MFSMMVRRTFQTRMPQQNSEAIKMYNYDIEMFSKCGFGKIAKYEKSMQKNTKNTFLKKVGIQAWIFCVMKIIGKGDFLQQKKK